MPERHVDWRMRWKAERTWTQQELARLCCGWDPAELTVPDPIAYNEAMNAIIRAVRVRDLVPLEASVIPVSRAEAFYGTGLFFAADAAMLWAADRYDSFPYLEATAPDASPTVVSERGDVATTEDVAEAAKAANQVARKGAAPTVMSERGEVATSEDMAEAAKAANQSRAKGPLRAHRYALIDAYQVKHGLEGRKQFYAHVGMSGSQVQGIVRDEVEKFAGSAKAKLLAKLGVTSDQWDDA